MRLDAVTAEIRPRSDWEAVDLGLAMVRRDFWRCLLVWWLAMLVPVALAGWWLWESPALWLMLFWWWKPAGSRMVLFEISRRLFGEKPALRESLREIPRAWTRRFFYRFVWARLSPWLPVTLAVEDLERLRGKAYRQRCGQVTRRGESAVMWIYFVADLAACWFGMAILAMVRMFMPEGQDGAWREALEMWNPAMPMDIPAVILRAVAVCVMLAMSLSDVFVTGAGFGVYINNRTWIEGWDVELAFKRLARRLTKTAVLLACLAACWSPAVSRAATERDPGVVMREVKADPDFKVHTIKTKVPKENKTTIPWLEKFFRWLGRIFGMGGAGAAEMLGRIFLISLLGILVALIAWIIWANRHSFLMRRGLAGGGEAPRVQSARVVMGMEVSPESLPRNLPDAAWSLWRQGLRQEALGLLYRGAISRVIELARVEIQESDTEGDCVRRVDGAGPPAHPEYFRGLTRAWTAVAYAGMFPPDHEVESLCRQWPFVERRDG